MNRSASSPAALLHAVLDAQTHFHGVIDMLTIGSPSSTEGQGAVAD
ncbi:hypothetical protein [Arthrobacter pigmenti]